MAREFQHKGLKAVANLDINYLADELLGEQETVYLIQDLIGGDCFRQERTDEVLVEHNITVDVDKAFLS